MSEEREREGNNGRKRGGEGEVKGAREWERQKGKECMEEI